MMDAAKDMNGSFGVSNKIGLSESRNVRTEFGSSILHNLHLTTRSSRLAKHRRRSRVGQRSSRYNLDCPTRETKIGEAQVR
ncbi:hypothetical protein PhaeoP128_02662 [Phaeobacter gallaeciensis]|nr:hypothetical protein PhaeoP129_02661 [Phaeobacter gallaeciensis]ATF23381.1 hypothetical protein PhaeoP128_02662 [Phaeobacter gallaeciensis]